MTVLENASRPHRARLAATPDRHVVIVAAQFPPSNLTAGHRTRLFAQHLPALGFRTTVLTVDPACYEEPLDEELTRLVGPEVRVLRTGALPVRPLRLVGDLGIRSFWFHYRALARLVLEDRVDLLYIPIPPNYSALLGPLLKRRFGIPYVIDYIDPWIYPITDSEKKSWKARLSHWLSRRLEPLAVGSADGITGVAEAYYQGVVERNPQLRDVPQAGIPYGADAGDHAYVQRTRRPSRLVDEMGLGNRLVLAYAGALLPRAKETLRVLFEGCRRVRERRPELTERMRLLFVGTGADGVIAKLAAEAGVGDVVTEIGARQPYLEVLALLGRAQAVMVLGSTEPHYTASKVFQAMHSDRPILALLHRNSSAVDMLRVVPGVELIDFQDVDELRNQGAAVAAALERLLAAAPTEGVGRDGAVLDSYSAYNMTRRLVECFHRVLANADRRARR